jgi:hypothetical protein
VFFWKDVDTVDLEEVELKNLNYSKMNSFLYFIQKEINK